LADAQVYRQLETVTSISVTNVPLADVLKQLAQRHGVAIVFDEDDLPSDCETRRTPVSWDIPEIRLGSLLDLMGDEFDVVHEIRGGAVVVSRWGTKQEGEEPNIVGSVYPLPPPSIGSAAYGEATLRDILGAVPLGAAGSFYGECFLPPAAMIVTETPANRDQGQRLAEIERILERADDTRPIFAKPRDPLCQRIVERLLQRTSLRLTGVTLDDFAWWLRQRHGIATVVDRQALWHWASRADARFSVAIEDEPLWTALEQVRSQRDLEYVVAHDVLWLTHVTAGENNSVVRLYPVGDLLGDGRRFSSRNLVRLVAESVEPASWQDSGGPGGIQVAAGHFLTVSHSVRVHGKVWRLLALLRNMDQPVDGAPDAAGLSPLEAALRRPAHVAYYQAKLKDAIADITATHGVALSLDAAAVKSADERISCDLGRRSLGVALQLMLAPLGLGIAPAENRVLVTTESECRWRVPAETMEVHDTRPLVDPDYGLMAEAELLEFLSRALPPGDVKAADVEKRSGGSVAGLGGGMRGIGIGGGGVGGMATAATRPQFPLRVRGSSGASAPRRLSAARRHNDDVRHHLVRGQLIATETPANQRLLSEMVRQLTEWQASGAQVRGERNDAPGHWVQLARGGRGIWIRAYAAFRASRGEDRLPPETMKALANILRSLDRDCDAPLFNVISDTPPAEEEQQP
jgi:hypothetical protein